jgi:hypothetical protein
VHVSWGAYEINVIASVASLLFALLWLAGWTRTRHGYMLTLAVGWVGLCAYWGLIAITAGEAPVVKRATMAPLIRGELMISMALLAAGKLAMVRRAYKDRAGSEEE